MLSGTCAHTVMPRRLIQNRRAKVTFAWSPLFCVWHRECYGKPIRPVGTIFAHYRKKCTCRRKM